MNRIAIVVFQVLLLAVFFTMLLGLSVFPIWIILVSAGTYICCWIPIHRRFTRSGQFELLPWIASSVITALVGSIICTVVGFNLWAWPIPMRGSIAAETGAIIVGTIFVTGMLWVVGIPDFGSHIRRLEATDFRQSE